eukprot:scaffold281557_cov40-Tisochrysis_lutea.AAC.2
MPPGSHSPSCTDGCTETLALCKNGEVGASSPAVRATGPVPTRFRYPWRRVCDGSLNWSFHLSKELGRDPHLQHAVRTHTLRYDPPPRSKIRSLFARANMA